MIIIAAMHLYLREKLGKPSIGVHKAFLSYCMRRIKKIELDGFRIFLLV